ncbi:hypothetical protein ACU8KH_03745 [Lachancea thermotolerans]
MSSTSVTSWITVLIALSTSGYEEATVSQVQKYFLRDKEEYICILKRYLFLSVLLYMLMASKLDLERAPPGC